MAFDKKPSTWLGAGYSYASNAITLNTAAHATPCLTTLSAAEANATTGDIRDVARAFLYKLAATWDATATADRPAKMNVRKTLSYDASGNAVESYAVSFSVGLTFGDVAAE